MGKSLRVETNETRPLESTFTDWILIRVIWGGTGARLFLYDVFILMCLCLVFSIVAWTERLKGSLRPGMVFRFHLKWAQIVSQFKDATLIVFLGEKCFAFQDIRGILGELAVGGMC